DVFKQLQPFAEQWEVRIAKAGDVTAGAGEILDDTLGDRIGDPHEHDRDAAGLRLQGQDRVGGPGEDDVRIQSYQLLGIDYAALGISRPANVDLDVLAIDPTHLLQRALELAEQGAPFGVVVASNKNAEPAHPLLRVRAEGPCRCAPEQRDELAAPHSIT